MINMNALIGSLIGVILLFILVGLFHGLHNKKSEIKREKISKKKMITEIFEIDGILSAPGCWIFSIIFIILHFLLYNQENVVKYIILAIIFNVAFQFLFNFLENEFNIVTKENTTILLSVTVIIITIVFFAFNSIFIKLGVLGIVLFSECVTIYREFTGIWSKVFDTNFYTLEDIIILYTPPLALFTAILITLF